MRSSATNTLESMIIGLHRFKSREGQKHINYSLRYSRHPRMLKETFPSTMELRRHRRCVLRRPATRFGYLVLPADFFQRPLQLENRIESPLERPRRIRARPAARDLLFRLLWRSYQTLLRHKPHLCSFGGWLFWHRIPQRGRSRNSNILLPLM